MAACMTRNLPLHDSQPSKGKGHYTVKPRTQKPQGSPFAWVNIHSDPKKAINLPQNRAIIARQATIGGRRQSRIAKRPDPLPPPDQITLYSAQDSISNSTQNEPTDDSTRDGNQAIFCVTMDESPLTPLSQATTDPFGALPDRMGKQQWRLLHIWLNASGTVVGEACRSDIARVRKHICYTYTLGSAATLNATLLLAAHGAGTMYGRNLVGPYLSPALLSLKKALISVKSNHARDLCLAMHLHLTISYKLGDLTACQTHFRGICALIAQHPKLLTHDPYISGALAIWSSAYIKCADERNKLPAFFRPEILELPRELPTITVDLRRRGLISEKLLLAIDKLSVIASLQRKAYGDDLSAHDVSEYWRCTWIFAASVPGLHHEVPTILDQVMVFVLHIHIAHLLGMLNLFIVSRMVRAVLNGLARFNTDWLVRHHPEVMLWVGLTAGPVAMGLAKKKFVDLTLAAASELGLENFHGAQAIFAQILTGVEQETCAGEFWDGIFESRFSAIPKALSTIDFDVPLPRDPTVCSFCGVRDCKGPIRRMSGASGYIEVDVAPSTRGTLFSTQAADLSFLCNAGKWYEVDPGFDPNDDYPPLMTERVSFGSSSYGGIFKGY